MHDQLFEIVIDTGIISECAPPAIIARHGGIDAVGGGDDMAAPERFIFRKFFAD